MSNPESGALGSRCRESSRAKLIYILVFESVSILWQSSRFGAKWQMFGAATGGRGRQGR